MVKTQQSLDELLSPVREAGKRITTPKRTVGEVLLSTKRHLTADEVTRAVQRKSPDVSQSTIYRILEEFEDLGLVVHAHLGQQAAVYHLASQVHGHLTCEVCGGTLEVPALEFDGISKSLHSQYGFSLNLHHVGLSGRCRSCS